MDFDTLSQNVGDLGKLIVAKGFKTCPKSNISPNLVTLFGTSPIVISYISWACGLHLSICTSSSHQKIGNIAICSMSHQLQKQKELEEDQRAVSAVSCLENIYYFIFHWDRGGTCVIERAAQDRLAVGGASLPKPEICSLNPVTGNQHFSNLMLLFRHKNWTF